MGAGGERVALLALQEVRGNELLRGAGVWIMFMPGWYIHPR